jgi:Holliday junction resolvase RusA-like endonuclease
MASRFGIAVQAPDVERLPKLPVQAKVARQKMDTRVRIAIHSRRRRLIDPDGCYAKAAIDGLAAGGLLVDDSAAYVESISYTQEKSEIEETIITVEEIEP